MKHGVEFYIAGDMQDLVADILIDVIEEKIRRLNEAGSDLFLSYSWMSEADKKFYVEKSDRAK
jgi:hypothetical protein